MNIRRLVLMLCAVLMLAACGHRNETETKEVVPFSKRTALQNDGLSGTVKMVVEKKYKHIGYLDTLDLFAIHYRYFAHDGRLLEDVVLNHKRDTMYHTVLTYNADGALVRSDCYDSTGVRSSYAVFDVDKNGFRLKESHYTGDSLVQQMTYKNDAFGNALSMRVVDKNDITLKYSYDASAPGLPVRVDNVGPDGTIFMYTTFEYNKAGQIVNRKAFSGSGSMVESNHSQYGKKGELLKETHELTLQSMQKKDVIIYSGHDAKGNWLKQESKRNDVPDFVIERTIQYY